MINPFTEKDHVPTEEELATTLGPSYPLWDDLKQRIAKAYAPVAEEWTFSGRQHGWSLRLKQKKRAILYAGPGQGTFRIGFVLGEKAVQAAMSQKLPIAAKQLMEHAPHYPEGRAVRLEVHGATEIELAEVIAKIKMG